MVITLLVVVDDVAVDVDVAVFVVALFGIAVFGLLNRFSRSRQLTIYSSYLATC